MQNHIRIGHVDHKGHFRVYNSLEEETVHEALEGDGDAPSENFMFVSLSTDI